MRRISTTYGFLLVIAMLAVTHTGQAETWPVKREIDLSSGFGDFRQNRFHAGVDIRTGGVEGVEIFSPVAGDLYRVKTSYYGYGKGLYIRGDDGHIYVFGHLSNYSGKIDSILKEKQIAEERYYQDLTFPKDSIRIEKGEFLGYTGQTGAGAPHLHLEKRTTDNLPLNPLAHGFKLDDKVRPVFTQVGFRLTDDRSLLDTGERQLLLAVKPGGKTAEYVIDTLLYFTAPFGVLAEGYDRMRTDGMRQAVYKLSLYLDDDLYYQSVFDTFDFETNVAVNLEYDFQRAVDDSGDTRLLFNRKGNAFRRSGAVNSIDGVFGQSGKEKYGKHKGRIVAEDCFGNESTTSFNFLWLPKEPLFALDSVTSTPLNQEYYFTAHPALADIAADSILVFMNVSENWGKPAGSTVERLEGNHFVAKVSLHKFSNSVLRLVLFTEGCLIRDIVFNGVDQRGKDLINLEYAAVEDGLLISMHVDAKRGSQARIELYYRDTLLGIESPRFFNARRYIAFVPPDPKYAKIDRIGYVMSKDTTIQTRLSDTLYIFLAGDEDNQEITIDGRFVLHLNRENFFEPRYIELRKNRVIRSVGFGINSEHYEIFPRSYAMKSQFTISLSLKPGNAFNEKSGICWLDERKNRWVWLENKFSGDTLWAKSLGGGSFAAVYDLAPPVIERLSLLDGRTYNNTRPNITFLLSDTLSGIEDDRSIIVKLDSQWQIPEYDPDTRQFKAKPREPLAAGKHHFGVIAIDRAGNRTEQYLNFFVKSQKR